MRIFQFWKKNKKAVVAIDLDTAIRCVRLDPI